MASICDGSLIRKSTLVKIDFSHKIWRNCAGFLAGAFFLSKDWHPEGTQEAPRRHPGAQGAPEGIFLINHHHSHAVCNNLPKLIILRCVFEGPSRIRWYLQGKMREPSLNAVVNVATDRSRPLYQHRKNPYS